MAIAGTIHVDQVSGNDANDGSTWALAKKTFGDYIAGTGAHKAASDLGAGTKRIIVWRGTFNEGDFTFPQNFDVGYIAPSGQVVFDGGSVYSNWCAGITGGGARYTEQVFAGITFKNYTCGSGGGLFSRVANHPVFAINCAFLATDPAVTGMQLNSSFQAIMITVLGCTMRGLVWRNGQGVGNKSYAFSNIIRAVTDSSHGNWTFGYNACADSDLRGTGGWDDVAFPPPFVNEGAFDYSFDPLHAQYAKYSTGGWYGGRVGASCFPGIAYIGNDTTGLGSGLSLVARECLGWSNHPLGAVINDERYYQTGVGPGPDGPADAGPAVLDGNEEWEIDTATVPTAMSARVVSPVFNNLTPTVLKQVGWTASESGASVIDNSSADTTRQIEYRGDNVSFAYDAAPGSTLVDWTMVTRGTIPVNTLQYFQWRAVLRMDGAV